MEKPSRSEIRSSAGKHEAPAAGWTGASANQPSVRWAESLADR
jgi:hypothetical protein